MQVRLDAQCRTMKYGEAFAYANTCCGRSIVQHSSTSAVMYSTFQQATCPPRLP